MFRKLPAWVAVLLLAVLVGATQGAPFRQQVRKPCVVFVTGDHAYSRVATMTMSAALQQRYGTQVAVRKSFKTPKRTFPAVEPSKTPTWQCFFSAGGAWL